MAEHFISFEDANNNLLACATFLAEDIRSADGHSEAMKQIIPRYIEKGDVDLAAGLADRVDDPFVRDRLLTFVAEKCAAMDDDEYAFQLVEAIEDYGTQAQARERIALQKTARNEFAKAQEIANTLEHPDEVFAAIALQQAAQDNDVEALKTLEDIKYPAAKVNALQNIALLKLQKDEKEKAVGLLDKATEAANDIEFTEEKVRALSDIANHFVEAGQNAKAIENFGKARSSAETIAGVHREVLLSAISMGFLRAGSLDLADRTLDLIADKTQIASTLTGFSQTFFERKEKMEALETLEEAYAILKSQRETETRDSRSRFALWGTISFLFARYDKPERAIEIAQENTDEAEQISSLSRIAQLLILKGKDELARLAMNAVEEDAQRMFALIGASDAKNKLGKKDEALKLLEEAYSHCAMIQQLPLRSSAYNEFTRRFHEYGETEKARKIAHESLETISNIRDESSRATSLAVLADVYEQAEFELTDAEKLILQTMARKAEW